MTEHREILALTQADFQNIIKIDSLVSRVESTTTKKLKDFSFKSDIVDSSIVSDNKFIIIHFKDEIGISFHKIWAFPVIILIRRVNN